MKEFQRKYRPKRLEDVVGQKSAVATLTQFRIRNNIPHAVLFEGPPGTGKTTLARILAGLVGAIGSDIIEINAASSRGIDTIREIQGRCSQAPFNPGSTARVWILDEVHQLSKRAGGDAQTAMLMTLEEPKEHVYFFLCSSEPHHLLKAIRSRCTPIKTNLIVPKEMKELLSSICKKEKIKLEPAVEAKLIDVAGGAARDALKYLDMLAGVKGLDERMSLLDKATAESESILLCRMMCNPRATWHDAKDLIKNLEEDPETIRRKILGYFTAIALSGGPLTAKAVMVLEIFRDNYYDCGKAGLVAGVYEFMNAGKKK